MSRQIILSTLCIAVLAAETVFAQVDPAEKVAEAFARSLMEATRLLAENHVVRATEDDMTRWAIEGLFKSQKEPVPRALTDRLRNLEQGGAKERHRLLYEARLHLRKADLPRDRDVKICLEAIFAKLEPVADRPSTYMSAEELANLGWGFQDSGKVGLKLESDRKTGHLRVVTPIYKSPAYKAGIRAGDLIVRIHQKVNVGGRPLPEPIVHSTKGMTVERAEELLTGKECTPITLDVIRHK